MTESTIAIVGSGVVGATIAYLLAKRGYDVAVFEKGPEFPYPHYPRFLERTHYAYDNPAYDLAPDLRSLTRSGDYAGDLNRERLMREGGSATVWGAVALRLAPHDFDTRSRYGFGANWPLTYDDLEPYYCDAERMLGVAGTDVDNPFAPRRSRPYPLPPFALSYDDRVLAGKLRRHGIVLHTTPQARTRLPYENRHACMNFGTCVVCPIGARYSPNYHLQAARETGRCRVYTNTSVRRIVMDRSGRARGLVFQPNAAVAEREHGAKVTIIAAGALESVRLLFLSSRERHPDGVQSGEHLGKHLVFHHAYRGRLHYPYDQRPGAMGPHSGLTFQFRDPPTRGKHGGAIVEFSSHWNVSVWDDIEAEPASAIAGLLRGDRRWHAINLQTESIPTPKKYVVPARERDRFGDPYIHVHYEADEFDYEGYRFARQIFDRFVAATDADAASLDSAGQYATNCHHMGGCRMGLDLKDSVVDRFGRVHGTPNLFVVGGGNFVSSGAVHPTLTMAALAIRAADYIIRGLL